MNRAQLVALLQSESSGRGEQYNWRNMHEAPSYIQDQYQQDRLQPRSANESFGATLNNYTDYSAYGNLQNDPRMHYGSFLANKQNELGNSEFVRTQIAQQISGGRVRQAREMAHGETRGIPTSAQENLSPLKRFNPDEERWLQFDPQAAVRILHDRMTPSERLQYGIKETIHSQEEAREELSKIRNHEINFEFQELNRQASFADWEKKRDIRRVDDINADLQRDISSANRSAQYDERRKSSRTEQLIIDGKLDFDPVTKKPKWVTVDPTGRKVFEDLTKAQEAVLYPSLGMDLPQLGMPVTAEGQPMGDPAMFPLPSDQYVTEALGMGSYTPDPDFALKRQLAAAAERKRLEEEALALDYTGLQFRSPHSFQSAY